MNIHTISNLQRYVQSYGLPKMPIRGFIQIYEHGLEYLPGKPTTYIKYQRKTKNSYLSIYGEIWVEKLKSSSYITYMMRFVIKEGEKPMKGLCMRTFYLLAMMI